MSADRNDTRSSSLNFEPEAGPQTEALAELASRPAAPKSSLAFEPDKGDVLDRVRDARLPREGPSEAKGDPRSAEDEDADIASLIELAANVEQTSASSVEPGKAQARSGRRRRLDDQERLGPPGAALEQGRTFTPVPRRADLSGDLEAELFGPKRGTGGRARGAREKSKRVPAEKPREPAREPASATDFSELSRAARSSRKDDRPGASSGRSSRKAKGALSRSRGWLSVLVSDAVVGRKRKQTTTHLLRSTRFAERAIGRTALGVAGALSRTDSFLRRARLSLAGLLATAGVVAVALVIGVPLAWAGGIIAICLLLTVAGQPARNLLGYAGVIIAAAAAAEIIRQRERFLEILKMFM